MNSIIFLKFTCLIIISLAYGDIIEECTNIEDGTFMPGTQGCKSYIYCEGEDSYEGFCPSQLLFNTKDGSCAPEDEVDCSDDIAPTEVETTPTTTTTTKKTTIITSTTKAIPEITSEEEIVPSELEESTTSQEPISDIPSTPKSVITTPLENGITFATPIPGQICPATDDPHSVVLLPSETSCSEYYICYHGTPVQMFCSGQLLFDYVSSKCELPVRVNCLVKSPTTPDPRKECVHNTYDYFPYPKNCNYFYKCMNGFLSLQQCPVGFGWSEEMKLCLKLDNGRCPTRAAGQQQNQSWLNNIYSV